MNDSSIISLYQLNDTEYNHKYGQLLKQIQCPVTKVFLKDHLNKISGIYQEKMKYLGYIAQGNPDEWTGDPDIKKEMDGFWANMKKQVIC